MGLFRDASILTLCFLYISSSEVEGRCTFEGDLCDLNRRITSNENKITEWVKQQHEIKNLHRKIEFQKQEQQRLVKEMVDLRRQLVRNNRPPPLPITEALVWRPEDIKESPFQRDAAVREEELSKNVSELLEKVEVVQSMTLEVQEKLESERRVRRHLQEDLNETQVVVRQLGDRLDKATAPLDHRVSQVEEVIFARLDNLNRTILEDYLHKFEYKVDGVVYKNETRRLDERLELLESEIVKNSTVSRELDSMSKALNQLITSQQERWMIVASRISALETDSAMQQNILSEKLQKLRYEVLILRKDIQNTTNKNDFLDSVWMDLSRRLDYWTNETDKMQKELVSTQTELRMISADVASVENRFDELKDNGALQQLESRLNLLEVLQHRIQNESEVRWNFWKESLSDLLIQIGNLQSRQKMLLAKDSERKNEASDQDKIRSRINLESGINEVPLENRSCALPKSDHSHLLVGVEDTEEGGMRLVFGCRPIGLFVLEDAPAPVRCERGQWKGPWPVCIRLLNGQQLGDIELQSLIPTVLVQPDNVDKPYGLMGTGPLGQLVVYPGTSFTLLCQFPQGPWGQALWNVKYKNSAFDKEGTLNPMTVMRATERDSGDYTCRTPFGKEHTIRVVVRAVKCPEIAKMDGIEVFYRPHPDAGDRILSSQVHFSCSGSSFYKDSASCLPTGHWSQRPPGIHNCLLPEGDKIVACPPLDIKHRPGLLLQKDEGPSVPGQTVYFSCNRPRMLVGDSFTRCQDNGRWSHDALPSCVSNLWEN